MLFIKLSLLKQENIFAPEVLLWLNVIASLFIMLSPTIIISQIKFAKNRWIASCNPEKNYGIGIARYNLFGNRKTKIHCLFRRTVSKKNTL